MKITTTLLACSFSLLLLLGCSSEDNADNDKTKNEETVNSKVNLINRINEIRGEVFSGSKLAWSDEVALSAKTHADNLAKENSFEHSNSGYGENLYASSATSKTYVDAVNSWYKEKDNYNLNTQVCETGKVCGHYTQVIWEDSIEVGCATSSSLSWNSIVVCQFNLAGNIIGETPF
jgi:pathogenesis-related protein 1